MKQIVSIILLLTTFGFLSVSCSSDMPVTDRSAIIRIDLQTDGSYRSLAGTRVALNYRKGTGAGYVIAEKMSDPCYEAVVPAGCTPADNFIEVRQDTSTYSYTPSMIHFEGGQLYRYSLVLTPSGLQEDGAIGVTVDGWVDGGSVDVIL